MNIVIVTLSKLPFLSPEGTRLMNFAKILYNVGSRVTFVSNCEINHETLSSFSNFQFYTSYNKEDRIKVTKHLRFDNYVFNVINNIINKTDVDCILCADVWPWTLQNLKTFSIKNRIKLVYDSVEWFSPNQFKMSFLSPFFIFKEIEMRMVIDSRINVISISNYLDDYFLKRNVNSIRIPVLMDLNEIPYSLQRTDKIKVVYAGSPGKKDYILNIIYGILNLSYTELLRFEFTFLGLSLSDISDSLSNIEKQRINRIVLFKGRVDRSVVLSILKDSDFTILVRSSKQRYAKAGFPTKVVESLATATCVISNMTSDLELYLKDGENSIILKSEDSMEITECLRRVYSLSNRDIILMKMKSRLTAERFFDLTIYSDLLCNFISE